jgi:succinate-acetate transporter protein
MLIVATLRLPVVFTTLFTLVDVVLLLSLLSLIQGSAGLQKAAGWVIMAFSAIGVYLFVSAGFHATGGKELPPGRPILHA